MQKLKRKKYRKLLASIPKNAFLLNSVNYVKMLVNFVSFQIE